MNHRSNCAFRMTRTRLLWLVLIVTGALGCHANDSAERVSRQLPALQISPERGYFTEPFTIALAFPSANALIRFTTDGSAPTTVTGHEYSGSFRMTNTTILRAAAFEKGKRVSA